MAQGSTNRIYFDNQMNFQMAPTEENPEGQVIILQQGWNEIPDSLKEHPLIKRMVPESEAEATRRQKIQEAENARNDAIAKAQEEFNKSVAETEQNRVEEYASRNEERLERIRKAQAQGIVAYEPHPDPDARRAETLTLPPATQMVSAAGMAYKGSESVSAAQTRVMNEGASASTESPTSATPTPPTRTRNPAP